MRRTETPKPIWIKFCTVVDIPEVVTYTNFGDHRLRVFGWRGSNFPLSHWLSSSPLQHSRTTVRACDDSENYYYCHLPQLGHLQETCTSLHKLPGSCRCSPMLLTTSTPTAINQWRYSLLAMVDKVHGPQACVKMFNVGTLHAKNSVLPLNGRKRGSAE